ncbi:MAG: homoserine kinase [SAR202 cluster bacterium Io17-Chloro-G7]|nr:MAG: homoserine kinase [SAR202 cluster bacterium Io17-Chloro-G7]
MTFTPFQVTAPATTANLGPGYDCLGLALDIWNRLEVSSQSTDAKDKPLVEIIGEGAGELETDEENLVYRSMEFLFSEAGQEMPPVRLKCYNEIPLARGLGSSAAAIAGGLAAANAICDQTFSSNDLLEMAATIEGHPDNVAAAVLGGLQLVVSAQDQLFTAAINVPADLTAVLFIPELRIATADARSVMPEKVTVADAVHNMSRTALLVAGMATNRPEFLGIATEDRLHQPYRQPLFPAMRLLFRAALDAGALGAFLSGSGSTVLALAQGREMTVAYEMAEAAKQAGVAGRVHITRPTVQGAHLVENPSA